MFIFKVLIIHRSHFSLHYDGAINEKLLELYDLNKNVKSIMDNDLNSDRYNIGINAGDDVIILLCIKKMDYISERLI